MWLYICLCLNLILKCDTKVSIKLLRDQLRVMKESHTLDMRVMHEEIDSLKEKLKLIESFINDTSVVKTEHNGNHIARTKYQADFVEDLQEGLEKLEAVQKSFVEYSALLQNGFKSLKTWNKQSLKNLESILEERLKNQEQDLLSRLDLTQDQTESCKSNIKELQKNTALSEDKTTQALQEIKDTYTSKSEFQTKTVSTDAKLNDIQTELGEIKNTFPKYQIKMAESQWEVIFRTQARNGASVYQAWVNGKGTTTTFPPENDMHYRNLAIDSWNNLDVKFVRLTLHDIQDEEVAFILFDGVRSDKMNWFAKYRILDSSWGQLNFDSSLNHASIGGDGQRKFYINVRYGGCENDHGFMYVLDVKNKGCAYERSTMSPQFLYSEFPGGVRWDSRAYGQAELGCEPECRMLPTPREFCRHILSERTTQAASNKRRLHPVSGGISL